MNRLALIKQAISSQITLQNLQTLQLTKEGSVATIWLNNTKKANAISIRMMEQFMFLLPTLDRDDSVKIITIRSKHPKVFCAGADIHNFFNNPGNKIPSIRTLHFGKTFRLLRKPLVAIIEGSALGGGFQIGLLSDIIICSEKATFTLPEVNMAIIPSLGGAQLLPRLVGTKVAQRLILTGETINAEEAQRLNIAYLISGQDFETKLKQFLTVLQNKAMDSLEAVKKSVKLSQEISLDQGLQHEATILQTLLKEKGSKEGITAFVEKRKPNFKNI